MVTHEHDLVRHFGGRIINITSGEIVFDEVLLGSNDDLISDSESMQYGYALDDSADESAILAASDMDSPAPKPEGPAPAENDPVNMLLDGEENELLGAGETPDIPIDEMTPDEVIAAISGDKTSGGAK